MNNFVPKDFLIKEIKNGDIVRVRGALLNYFVEDSADEKKEIKKAIAYAETNCPNLWLNNDVAEYEINEDVSKWNDEYYSLQLVYLGSNFSKKRVEHILKVGKHLYTKPSQAATSVNQSNLKKNTTTSRTFSQNQPQRYQRNHSQNKNQNKTLLMLSILIIAIIMIVVIVIVMNNNQPQAMRPMKDQIVKSMNQVVKIVHLNL